MKLSVYSLKNVLYEGEAQSVNCTTDAGEITVLARHEPLIATLKPGTITITDAERKAHYFETGKGFIEVMAGNEARILVDEAM
jgi:F0F1-type ATP synthase epsilon subunit